jgi:hypothetical protein
MLDHSRSQDTLTLWHLLPRVNEDERVLVYEKMEGFAAPPAGVTRDGVLKLDQNMLEIWRISLEGGWILKGAGKGIPKGDKKSLKSWFDLKLKNSETKK